MVAPLTTEFLELAIELIDEFVPENNAIWNSIADGIPDPDSPWETIQGVVLEYDVRLILFPYGLQSKKFLQYMMGTEIPQGSMKGLMYPTDFEPKLKDTVTFEELSFNVARLNAHRPFDDIILWEIDLLL